MAELDRELRTHTHSVHTHSTRFTTFLEQIAGLLSDRDDRIYASEDEVRRRIETIVYMNRDLRSVSKSRTKTFTRDQKNR